MTDEEYTALGRLAAEWLRAAPPHQTKAEAQVQERKYMAMWQYWRSIVPSAGRRVMRPVLGRAEYPGGGNR